MKLKLMPPLPSKFYSTFLDEEKKATVTTYVPAGDSEQKKWLTRIKKDNKVVKTITMVKKDYGFGIDINELRTLQKKIDKALLKLK